VWWGVQADRHKDENALKTLKLRQSLLDQQLRQAEARRRPPMATAAEYPESLLPVVTFCRELVQGVAAGVVERSAFRPNAHAVAKCALDLSPVLHDCGCTIDDGWSSANA
jgi:hypothetical protein